MCIARIKEATLAPVFGPAKRICAVTGTSLAFATVSVLQVSYSFPG